MTLTMKEKRNLKKGIAAIVALVFILLMAAFPVFALAEGAVAAENAEEAPKFVIDLTMIVEAVFALLAAIITYKLVPFIKSKTTASQQAKLQATINTVVYAAEQLYGAGRGEEKLDYALNALEKMGYKIESEAIRVGIEAAVKALNLTQDEIVARSIITIPDLQD